MFYFSIYFIMVFVFFNNFIGASVKSLSVNDVKRRRLFNDVILTLKTRKNKKNKKNGNIKKIKKNRNIKKIKNTEITETPILINTHNSNSFDKIFSEIIGCLSIPKVTHGHIFHYFNYFLYDILENNSIANKLILDELKDDIDLFLVLLMSFIDNKKNIDIPAIKNYILESNKKLENLYYYENKGSFLDKNSYIIETNNNLIFKIYNFLEAANIKNIIEKVKNKKQLDETESNIFDCYELLISLIDTNKIWRINNNLNNNDLIMTKITNNNNIIKQDIDLYLYSIKEEIANNNDNIFKKILTTYLYYLLLSAGVISDKLFKSTISNSIFDKKEINESFSKIKEAFQISENTLSRLWTIISQNKQLFSDPNQYKYIETIDEIGGITEYFKKYIMQKKPKNSSFVEKIKDSGPTILKVVGSGLLIVGGIYAADKILGGNFIKKTTEGLTNFIKTGKDNIFNWFKKSSSTELLYKTSSTNFIEKGLLSAAGGVNNIIVESTKRFLPAWSSSGAGAFISGMGLLALQQETSNLITKNVLQPIAQKLGFYGIDTNFSFYKYTKNKIVDFLNSVKTYYKYIISGHIINESVIIEKRFEYQQAIKKAIILADANKNKNFKKIESLFFQQLKHSVGLLETERSHKELKEIHYKEFLSKV